MKNEAEVFMSALTTLKLCWAIHKSNEAVRKCAGLLKRKIKEHLAYESMRKIEGSSNPMLVITLAEWELEK
ncbi:hypothetical protein JEP11_01420 [Proteus mirabilis]|uniref:DUF7740 domain-containing protein n=1 Tax=Proteus mirabilis TaxID=584 RepID=UPI0013DE874E|nr:hypothetical protein [Proteus mirabilis]MBG2872740.1 hypothetical protein [Proteus mirabilis]MBI6520589.1 hypothetical protein [Proteus mirabilis]MCE5371299.1 hypothetical protein [Proteus mirabilis]QIF47944.1 hypothetical protein FU796_06855 [Proteus mirabilis]HEJ9506394.1 hypothetical protein [Proteus mirabilis]